MNTPLSPQAIIDNPNCITRRVTLPSGAVVTLRALRAGDAAVFGHYLEGLSAETARRFGPHPLTMSAARALCAEIDYRKTLRLLALTGQDAPAVAYFILQLGVSEAERGRYRGYGIALDDNLDCTFAPSVADACQSQGVGSALMPHVLDLARRLGRRWMVLMGGVQATNHRAIGFYEKFGFRKVGDFRNELDNHDMMRALS